VTSVRTLALATLAAVALLGSWTADARATTLLTYDLRATDTGAKTVQAGLGDVVSIDLYAVVANLDGDSTNDGFLITTGSFVSDSGPLFGDLRGDVLGQPHTTTNNVAPFNAPPSQSGFQTDLDGDGDLDVGNLDATTVPAPNSCFFATASIDPIMGTDTSEFLIGRITFTVTGGTFGDTTDITYLPQIRTVGTTASRLSSWFTSDGVLYTLKGDDSRIATSSLQVQLVPEPVTMTVLLLGAGALLRYLRRR